MTYRFPCVVFPDEALLCCCGGGSSRLCREMIWTKIGNFLTRYPLSPFLNNCVWWLTVLSLQVGGKARELQKFFFFLPSVNLLRTCSFASY